MPLIFSQPEPAPEKPKSWLRKAFAYDHVIRVLWALLAIFNLYNGTMAAVFYHRPFSAGFDFLAATWWFLFAWDRTRASGWIVSGVAWVIKRIVAAWKYTAPIAVTAVTVPYVRLSDRYGLYGKTLRMRARLRRIRNKIRKNR